MRLGWGISLLSHSSAPPALFFSQNTPPTQAVFNLLGTNWGRIPNIDFIDRGRIGAGRIGILSSYNCLALSREEWYCVEESRSVSMGITWKKKEKSLNGTRTEDPSGGD